MRLVNTFKSAAQRYGTERRVILLHGPVGSSKSSDHRTPAQARHGGVLAIARGAIYTYYWHLPGSLNELAGGQEIFPCPMHEDPLKLIPRVAQQGLHRSRVARRRGRGRRQPGVSLDLRQARGIHRGDWATRCHVKVKRLILSEQDRVGIGTFQPKDEKTRTRPSSPETSTTEDRRVRQRLDPRAFNFDGEFNIANRGIIEFVEILLDVAFLYDLLGATQEHRIKPKKFAQTEIDEVILGHTNEAEYKKLLNNEFMEALRDRTVKIDIPYITRVSEEVKIYKKDYTEPHSRQAHRAAHAGDRGRGGSDALEIPRSTI